MKKLIAAVFAATLALAFSATPAQAATSSGTHARHGHDLKSGQATHHHRHHRRHHRRRH